MVSSLLSTAIYQTHDYHYCYSQISPSLEHISLTSKYLSHRVLTPTTFILVTAAIQDNSTLVIDHIRLSTSKKNCFICSNKSPLKMMKNAFYFILKAFFVLKIFNYLSCRFGHIEKTTRLERQG